MNRQSNHHQTLEHHHENIITMHVLVYNLYIPSVIKLHFVVRLKGPKKNHLTIFDQPGAVLFLLSQKVGGDENQGIWKRLVYLQWQNQNFFSANLILHLQLYYFFELRDVGGYHPHWVVQSWPLCLLSGCICLEKYIMLIYIFF